MLLADGFFSSGRHGQLCCPAHPWLRTLLSSSYMFGRSLLFWSFFVFLGWNRSFAQEVRLDVQHGSPIDDKLMCLIWLRSIAWFANRWQVYTSLFHLFSIRWPEMPLVVTVPRFISPIMCSSNSLTCTEKKKYLNETNGLVTVHCLSV